MAAAAAVTSQGPNVSFTVRPQQCRLLAHDVTRGI